MSLQEAKQFVARFIAGDYSPEEYEAFLRWLKRANNEELNVIADEHESLHELWAADSAFGSRSPSPEWVTSMEKKLDGSTDNREHAPLRRLQPDRVIGRRTWAVAAAVIVLLSTGVYLYRSEGKKSDQTDGPSLAALSNTFSNPRGGEQKQLLLPDGSKVWLNASSTLRYPAHFDDKDRVVQLSGEAYFEVAPNSLKPFRVLIKDAKVEVLGTNFNIAAYEDESISRTTLISGSVRMESGDQSVVLYPGQQAEIPYPSPGVASAIKVNVGVDPDAAVAWKSGMFEFDAADVYEVMRVLSRSYNVDIQADPSVPGVKFTEKKITGNFPRKDGLPQIIKELSTMNIRFANDGKRILVTL
jgi:ferric-dicitrate binding protein FerR (iron transport regulator)